MSGLLADLYSAGDRMKRKLGGLLSNPLETIALGSTRMAEDTNALTRLMSEAGYMPNTVNRSDQSVLVSEQQKALARALLADKGAEMGMAAATVWHGSPHKFDKFDSSKIGTGEGAQAYGHGLYLAESPAVAKEYQQALGAGRGNTDADTIARLLDSVGGDPAKAAAAARQRAQYANIPGGKEKLESIAQQIEKGFDPRGNLYKVDLPDNAIARMLDWDKPLSQQAPEVQAAVGKFNAAKVPPSGLDMGGGARLLANHNGQIKPNSSSPWVLKSGDSVFDISEKDVQRMLSGDKGEAAYTRLTALLGGQPQATEHLRQAGIPGIRYLDGGSRGAGQGTSNYVVFPGQEDILTILERNGVPIK